MACTQQKRIACVLWKNKAEFKKKEKLGVEVDGEEKMEFVNLVEEDICPNNGDCDVNSFDLRVDRDYFLDEEIKCVKIANKVIIGGDVEYDEELERLGI